MTPKLWPSIEVALDESEYFLLLASVESRRSKWVQREVEYWLQNKPLDKLLIIVTGPRDGEDASDDFKWIRANLLPTRLTEKLPDEEPLYLDLRWVKSVEQLSTRNPRFLSEVAGLVATLTGRAKDELIGEDVKQHRRVRRLAWSAVALLVLLTIASVLAAVWAAWQRDNAIARQWVAISTSSQNADPEISVLSASQGVAATWAWAHTVLPEAEQQLHHSILASHVKLILRGHVGPVWSVAWSPDGSRIGTASADHTAKVWVAATGTELLTVSGHRRPLTSIAWSLRCQAASNAGRK